MNRDAPEDQETAVLQALVVNAIDGHVGMSERQLAKVTGFSRTSIQRTLIRLTKTGQLRVARIGDAVNPTMWEIPAQRVAHQVAQGNRENGVPTMPFQLLPPSGVGSSWFVQTLYRLTRAYADMASGKLAAECIQCADTGYFLRPTSVEYSREWLKVCHCQAGKGTSLPEHGQYEPDTVQGHCQMCGSSGWVTLRNGNVQRCYSCYRTVG